MSERTRRNLLIGSIAVSACLIVYGLARWLLYSDTSNTHAIAVGAATVLNGLASLLTRLPAVARWTLTIVAVGAAVAALAIVMFHGVR